MIIDEYECCWTCSYLIFDLDKRKHLCRLDKKVKDKVHFANECAKWSNNINK